MRISELNGGQWFLCGILRGVATGASRSDRKVITLIYHGADRFEIRYVEPDIDVELTESPYPTDQQSHPEWMGHHTVGNGVGVLPSAVSEVVYVGPGYRELGDTEVCSGADERIEEGARNWSPVVLGIGMTVAEYKRKSTRVKAVRRSVKDNQEHRVFSDREMIDIVGRTVIAKGDRYVSASVVDHYSGGVVKVGGREISKNTLLESYVLREGRAPCGVPVSKERS